MKVTIKCLLFNTSNTCESIINKMMLQFSSAKRFSYNVIVKNLNNTTFKPQHIENNVSEKYNLNIRYAKDAVEEARQTKQSQLELLDTYISDLDNKIEKILNVLEKPGLKIRTRNSNISKLDKRLRKLCVLLNHKKNNTLPSIIWGGKDNFYNRCKNNITNAEYKANRNNQLVSRGDKTKTGNPNLRVVEGENGFYFLEITTLEKKLNKNNEPSNQYVKIQTPLYIPEKLSKKTGKINGFHYKIAFIQCLTRGDAYKVELLKRNGKIYAHITFDMGKESLVATGHNYMFGVDTNPNGLALTMINRKGNYIWHFYIKNSELLHVNGNKRDNICGNIAKTLINIAKHYGAAISVEDLYFKDNVDVKCKFKRTKHQFCYSKIIKSIEAACYKYGVELNKVKPHYTSKIGLYKYCTQYGMDVHNGAAMVIARRAYGYTEKASKLYKKLFNPIKTISSKGKITEEVINCKDEFTTWAHINKRIKWILQKENNPRFFIENHKYIIDFINI